MERQKMLPRPHRKYRSLAQELVAGLSQQIRDGEIKRGDKLPTEAVLMDENGVSRTVVREALSRMQANGLVETCHGVGTFVLNTPSPSGLRIDPATIVSLRDMLAVLELRNGLEVDSAGLAAQRRNKQQLEDIRDALDNFKKSANQTSGIQASDFQFHMRICEATGNNYFIDIMQHIGACVIPRLQLYSEDFQLHDLKLSLISEYDQVYDA
ncbi:MAG: GntR family transcriptional regulator [Pseudomonadaceae bacterium]|nr:GntR family transcriptional regulator [Pseudomonadaceae bacterium]